MYIGYKAYAKDIIDQYKYLNMQCINLIIKVANIKIYLTDARRELTHTRIELTNKKIQNIEQGALTTIIITLPLQNTFINLININNIKANYLAKMPDTPEYINKCDDLKPWII